MYLICLLDSQLLEEVTQKKKKIPCILYIGCCCVPALSLLSWVGVPYPRGLTITSFPAVCLCAAQYTSSKGILLTQTVVIGKVNSSSFYLNRFPYLQLDRHSYSLRLPSLSPLPLPLVSCPSFPEWLRSQKGTKCPLHLVAYLQSCGLPAILTLQP